MNYTQIRSFYSVAKTGSFTAAAKELNVSQPTISEQVRELEAYYRIKLFNRTQRKVRLTVIGRSLYEITNRLFSIVNETKTFLKDIESKGVGHLKVISVLPFFVVEILTAFRERYPNVKVSVMSGNSTTTMRGLLDHESDVGVLSDHLPDSRLYTTIHGSHSIVAIVSSDHPWANRTGIRISELNHEPIVLREVGSNTRRAFEAAAAKLEITPNVVLEIEGGEAVREAVAEGHGIGVYGEHSLPSSERLKVLPFIDINIRVNRYIGCLKERRNEVLIRDFFKIANKSS